MNRWIFVNFYNNNNKNKKLFINQTISKDVHDNNNF